MKFACKTPLLLLLWATAFAQTSPNPLAKFKHVVVIFQENRTPDNLFQGLPTGAGYDISSTYTDTSGHQQPLAPVPFANNWDLDHSHNNFVAESSSPGVPVKPSCGANTFACALNAWNQFMFVENTTVSANGVTQGVLQPYLDLATQYGWGNRMFQSNQGPSYPAHQFIFSGTSALTAGDDSLSTFVSENFRNGKDAGCLADIGETNSIISPNPSGVCPTNPPPPFTSCTCYNNNTVKECVLPNTGFTYCVGHNNAGHQSMRDLLDNATPKVSWKYYAPSDGSIWTAPDAFDSICMPVTDPQTGEINCSANSEFKTNVVLNPPQIFTDITSCNLAGVTWVIPDGRWSDHANVGAGLGPSWVASIVNTIGQNPACTNLNNEVYWQDTAIIITWDDWGGWFDHVSPNILTPAPPCTSTNCPGDYQHGFRVPLIVVSAYTPPAYINNMTHDFGTVLRMIEGTFNLGEGSLGFADFRANTDLSGFFSLTTARSFMPITTIEGPSFFLTLPGAPVAPDGD